MNMGEMQARDGDLEGQLPARGCKRVIEPEFWPSDSNLSDGAQPC